MLEAGRFNYASKAEGIKVDSVSQLRLQDSGKRSQEWYLIGNKKKGKADCPLLLPKALSCPMPIFSHVAPSLPAGWFPPQETWAPEGSVFSSAEAALDLEGLWRVSPSTSISSSGTS